MRDRDAIDQLILGGTELAALILTEAAYPDVPILNTARIHAEAAVDWLLTRATPLSGTSPLTFHFHGGEYALCRWQQGYKGPWVLRCPDGDRGAASAARRESCPASRSSALWQGVAARPATGSSDSEREWELEPTFGFEPRTCCLRSRSV